MLRRLGRLMLSAVAAIFLFCLLAVIVLNLRFRLNPDWQGNDIQTVKSELGAPLGGAMDEYIWGRGFPADVLPLVVKGVSVLVEPEKTVEGWKQPVSSVQPMWIFFGFLFLNFSYEPGNQSGLFCFWTDQIKRCDNWL